MNDDDNTGTDPTKARWIVTDYVDRDGELWRIVRVGEKARGRQVANFVPTVLARRVITDGDGERLNYSIRLTRATTPRSATGDDKSVVVEVDAARPLAFLASIAGLVVAASSAVYLKEAIARSAAHAPVLRESQHTGWHDIPDGRRRFLATSVTPRSVFRHD